MGLNPGSPGSRPGLKVTLNHWATRAAQMSLFYCKAGTLLGNRENRAAQRISRRPPSREPPCGRPGASVPQGLCSCPVVPSPHASLLSRVTPDSTSMPSFARRAPVGLRWLHSLGLAPIAASAPSGLQAAPCRELTSPIAPPRPDPPASRGLDPAVDHGCVQLCGHQRGCTCPRAYDRLWGVSGPETQAPVPAPRRQGPH